MRAQLLHSANHRETRAHLHVKLSEESCSVKCSAAPEPSQPTWCLADQACIQTGINIIDAVDMQVVLGDCGIIQRGGPAAIAVVRDGVGPRAHQGAGRPGPSFRPSEER